MHPDRWERIQALFHAALLHPAEDRDAIIREGAGDDADLAAIVVEMLRTESTPSLLDSPLASVAHDVLSGDEPERPNTIGPYVVESRLGSGGMGVVYRARRPEYGTLVAIKVLRDAWVSPGRHEQFVREQRTLAQLTHPAIARILDAGTSPDGAPWFAMDLVEGVPVTSYARDRLTTTRQQVRLLRHVCDAVSYAHRHFVAHCDLKPSNILVTTDGSVKLLDFGIARYLAAAQDPASTLQYMTPGYAAPEQLGGHPGDVAADIYALGAVLYEVLSGRPAFNLAAAGSRASEGAILETDPPPPSLVVSPPPGRRQRYAWRDLDAICQMALQRDRAGRYGSVDALRRDLDAWLEERPLPSIAPTWAVRARKFVRRHRMAAAASTAVGLILTGLSAYYAVTLSEARQDARREAERAHRVQLFVQRLFEGGQRDAAPTADLTVASLLATGVQEAEALDSDPVLQSDMFITLGRLYLHLGILDRADDLLSRALAERRQVEDEPSALVEALIALANLRLEQGRLDEAMHLASEGRVRAAATLPLDHPARLQGLIAAGRVLRDRGQLEEAQAVLENAFDTYGRRAGTEYEFSDVVSALANTKFYLGRLEESERLNQQALALDRRLYGEAHPNIAHSLLNLGAIHARRGAETEAAAAYRQALGIMRAWYGDRHPETASTMAILSQTLERRGQLEEARELAAHALEVQRQVYGPRHTRVAFAINQLGMIELRRDQLDEARVLFEQAADIWSTSEGVNYRHGVALGNLAEIHLRRGELADAETRLQAALAVYARSLPADHVLALTARASLGHLYVLARRWTDAEPLLREPLEKLTTGEGVAPETIRNLRQDLVTLYTSLGRTEEAAAYRGEPARP